VDRLSVSFAPEYERTSWSESDYPPHPHTPTEIPSDVSVRVNVFNMNEGVNPGGSPSPVMPSGQGHSFYQGNRLSAVVVSGLTIFTLTNNYFISLKF
jgi:hypothetical protein